MSTETWIKETTRKWKLDQEVAALHVIAHLLFAALTAESKRAESPLNLSPSLPSKPKQRGQFFTLSAQTQSDEAADRPLSLTCKCLSARPATQYPIRRRIIGYRSFPSTAPYHSLPSQRFLIHSRIRANKIG